MRKRPASRVELTITGHESEWVNVRVPRPAFSTNLNMGPFVEAASAGVVKP